MWLVATFSAFVCAAVIYLLERAAPRIGLVDRPDERKLHVGQVPLVGGLSIFIAMTVCGVVLSDSVFPVPLLLGGGVLIVLGVVDDLKDLSARFRLLAQCAVVSLLFFYGDMRILSVGPIFGGSDVELREEASYLFTVFCAIGVINAINMIDGLDGLAGSLLLVSFSALAVLGHASGDVSANTLFMVCGGLASFLAFNTRVFRERARIFMGDSGSMFLGLVLTWYLIDMTQSDSPSLGSVSAGWVLGLPLMETVSVMLGRILDKRSPFSAGRDHMHHRLQRAGFSVNYSVALMLVMHILLVVLGSIFAQSVTGQSPLFWLFVFLTVVHFSISRFYLEPMGSRVVTVVKGVTDTARKRRAKI